MTWEARLRSLVERRTGIRLELDNGSAHWRRFLERRAGAASLAGPDAWLEAMESDSASASELMELIALAAIPYTWFFRDRDQFESIRTLLTQGAGRSRKQLWSAGCSTGEEAWSLAMLCAEAGVDATILATDLRPDSLQKAKAGVYSDWSLRDTPPELQQRWLSRVEGGYRVCDELRTRVEFRTHNLALEPLCSPAAGGGWDLIVCRNVVMYWAPETADRVVRAMTERLGPDGWLVVGVAESLRLLRVELSHSRIAGSVVYRAPAPPMGSCDGTRAVSPEGVAHAGAVRGRDPALPSYARAIAQLTSGDTQGGRATLDALLSSNPRHLLARLTLGNQHVAAHELERALDSYVQALALDPLLPEVHYLLGVVYRKLGDLSLAEESFRRALFLHPGFWPASYLLACTAEKLGAAGVALREYARTLHLVERPAGEPLFQSHVGELDTLELPLAQVACACRARMSRRTAPEEAWHGDHRHRR